MMATRARASSLLHRISDLRHSRLFAAAYSGPFRGGADRTPIFPFQYRIRRPMLVGINVVPSQTVYVVERDGKYHKTLGSGLHFLNPFSDKIAHVHSLKELTVSPRMCEFKTLDEFDIVDPLLASYKDCHPILETMNVFQRKMSSHIRSVTQDKLLEQLDILFDNVVKDVNIDTAAWGVECLRCGIGSLSFFPPKAVSMDMDDRGKQKKCFRKLKTRQ